MSCCNLTGGSARHEGPPWTRRLDHAHNRVPGLERPHGLGDLRRNVRVVNTIGALSADPETYAQPDGVIGLILLVFIWGMGAVLFDAWAGRARARAVSQRPPARRDP